MKWVIIGLCVTSMFFIFLGPPIYRAMKKKDYDNLYNGMKQTRIDNGAYHEITAPRQTYIQKYVSGNTR